MISTGPAWPSQRSRWLLALVRYSTGQGPLTSRPPRKPSGGRSPGGPKDFIGQGRMKSTSGGDDLDVQLGLAKSLLTQDLKEGQHRNPGQRPDWWTTAYFHHPDEFRAAVTEGGLVIQELVGLEGLAMSLPQLASRWANPDDREAILWSARGSTPRPYEATSLSVCATSRGRLRCPCRWSSRVSSQGACPPCSGRGSSVAVPRHELPGRLPAP